ncbi:MAG: DUF4340 domain-containing protein [Gammaproteobacteria bacterium]
MKISSRAWVNLALFILLAGLAVFAFYEAGKEPPGQQSTLTVIDPGKISQIRINHKDGEIISLIKDVQGWRLNQPISVPANSGNVQQLLGLARTSSYAQFDVRGVDMAKYKLDTPGLYVEFDGLELVFGGTEPLEGRRYVRVGQVVHLIDDSGYRDANIALAALVSPALLPAGFKQMEIKLPNATISRAEDGRWTSAPARADLSADVIQRLVDEWQRAEAHSVETYAPDGKALGEIVVRLEPTAELRFEIVAREPELILARRDIGMQYHFTAEQAKRLFLHETSKGRQGNGQDQ